MQGPGECADRTTADQAEHRGGQVRVQHGHQLGRDRGQIHAQAIQGLPLPSGGHILNSLLAKSLPRN